MAPVIPVTLALGGLGQGHCRGGGPGSRPPAGSGCCWQRERGLALPALAAAAAARTKFVSCFGSDSTRATRGLCLFLNNR